MDRPTSSTPRWRRAGQRPYRGRRAAASSEAEVDEGMAGVDGCDRDREDGADRGDPHEAEALDVPGPLLGHDGRVRARRHGQQREVTGKLAEAARERERPCCLPKDRKST